MFVSPRCSLIGLIAFMLFGCAACGRSGPPRAPRFPVTGTVLLDGQPLAGGTISFESSEDLAAGRAPASAEIHEGKYQLESTPGDKQVKVFYEEQTGQVDKTGLEITRQIIPARYNTETELKAHVAEEGSNEFNFDLQSR
jgi:hypothetical protein